MEMLGLNCFHLLAPSKSSGSRVSALKFRSKVDMDFRDYFEDGYTRITEGFPR